MLPKVEVNPDSSLFHPTEAIHNHQRIPPKLSREFLLVPMTNPEELDWKDN